MSTAERYTEFARLGSATVYEAGGRGGYVDAELIPGRPGLKSGRPRPHRALRPG